MRIQVNVPKLYQFIDTAWHEIGSTTVSLSWRALNRRISKGIWVAKAISRGGLFGF